MESRSGEQIEQSTQKLLQDLKMVVADGEALLRLGPMTSANERWRHASA